MDNLMNSPAFRLSFPRSSESVIFIGVANGKGETARPAFFFANPRHFNFLDCETETSKCLTPWYKKRDCETHISAQKTRLRDPWNSTRILRDPEFLKSHPPPSIYEELIIGLRVVQSCLSSYWTVGLQQIGLPNTSRNIHKRKMNLN